MGKIQAIEYDADFEVLELRSDFDTMKEAMEWCEARRGEKIEWGDTEFGFSGMTEAERTAIGETNEFPPRQYEVHGCEADGSIRYLEEEEWPGA